MLLKKVGVNSMKLKKKIILKKNISDKEVEDLCKIKSENWDYNLKSQINWWNKNSDEDYLIITLLSEKKKVAFLRIRKREIFMYNKCSVKKAATMLGVSVGTAFLLKNSIYDKAEGILSNYYSGGI